MPSTCFHEGRHLRFQPRHIWNCFRLEECSRDLGASTAHETDEPLLCRTGVRMAQRPNRQHEQHTEARATLASNRGPKTQGLQLLQLTDLEYDCLNP